MIVLLNVESVPPHLSPWFLIYNPLPFGMPFLLSYEARMVYFSALIHLPPDLIRY